MKKLSEQPFYNAVNAPYGVDIVHASHDDADVLKALHRSVRVNTDARFYYDYAQATSRSSYYEDLWGSVFDDPTRTVLKAVRGEKIIGFITVGPSEQSDNYAPLHDLHDSMGELHQLYLDPADHGSGVGAKLYSAGAKALADNGYSSMAVNVIDKNAHAQAFYEKMNGTFHGRVREDIERGHDTYVVFCSLFVDNDIERFRNVEPSAPNIQIR